MGAALRSGALPAPLGCPLTYPRREIVNVLLYIAHTACQWRALPHDFPPWPTVYYHFQRSSADGTLDALHTALRELLRQAAGRDPQPSAGICDSQTVKVASCAGPRGYGGGKKITGRKRHLLVDTLGLLLMVLVTAANVSETAGARQVALLAKRRFPRLRHLWDDSTYSGALVDWLATWCGWGLEIVRHRVLGSRVRGARPPVGGGTDLRLVEWVPTLEQGLRSPALPQ